MSMTFPRLRIVEAERILGERRDLSLADLEALAVPPLTSARFPPTGPGRVQMAMLHELREQLTVLARKAGYPTRTERAFRDFDRACAEYLGALDLPAGEMLRREVWTWIEVHLVPHLVEWRWGSDGAASLSRYGAKGLQRNAIGRLWYRAFVMRDPGDAEHRWATLRLVNEDAHSGILERTAIARDRRLSRAIVQCWHRHGAEESLLRAALICIRVQALLIELQSLSDDELSELIDWAFRRVRFSGAIDPLMPEPSEAA